MGAVTDDQIRVRTQKDALPEVGGCERSASGSVVSEADHSVGERLTVRDAGRPATPRIDDGRRYQTERRTMFLSHREGAPRIASGTERNKSCRAEV